MKKNATAIARFAELVIEIAERRLDYTEDCKRLDAKIVELEAALAAARERNVVLQSEHLQRVDLLHKRIKELEADDDHS